MLLFDVLVIVSPFSGTASKTLYMCSSDGRSDRRSAADVLGYSNIGPFLLRSVAVRYAATTSHCTEDSGNLPTYQTLGRTMSANIAKPLWLTCLLAQQF